MVKIHFNELDSTNKYLMNFHDQLDDLTVVSCDYQKEGKGREDRSWISKKGENLLLSFLVKNPENIRKFPLISICTAVIVMRTLRKLGVKNVKVKWPNDVYVNDKKICGILLQGSLPNYLVVGLGLNVNQTIFDGDYRTAPTSIKNELGIEQDIKGIETKIVKQIPGMLLNLEILIKEAQEYDYLLTKTRKINGVEVQCLGIQDDGTMKIVQNGVIKYINSAEIS